MATATLNHNWDSICAYTHTCIPTRTLGMPKVRSSWCCIYAQMQRTYGCLHAYIFGTFKTHTHKYTHPQTHTHTFTVRWWRHVRTGDSPKRHLLYLTVCNPTASRYACMHACMRLLIISQPRSLLCSTVCYLTEYRLCKGQSFSCLHVCMWVCTCACKHLFVFVCTHGVLNVKNACVLVYPCIRACKLVHSCMEVFAYF